MNDLMSGGLHRAWKDALVTALNPPQAATRRSRCSIVAGGTGDIAFRAAKAGGPRIPRHRLRHQRRDARGRPRARRERGISMTQVIVRRRQCRGAAFPDRASTPYTIAFGIRNVPRIDVALQRSAIACCKLGGRFLCLEFSIGRRAGPRHDLRPLFVQRDPGDRPRRHRRRRVLSLSRRIDPQVSQARTPSPTMIARRRLLRASASTPMTGGIVALHSGWRL